MGGELLFSVGPAEGCSIFASMGSAVNAMRADLATEGRREV